MSPGELWRFIQFLEARNVAASSLTWFSDASPAMRPSYGDGDDRDDDDSVLDGADGEDEDGDARNRVDIHGAASEQWDYVEDLIRRFISAAETYASDRARRSNDLPPSSLDALPVIPIRREDIADRSPSCVVCKDEFQPDELVQQLPCLHLYHRACIVPWLVIRNSCPLCRFQLPAQSLAHVTSKGHGESIMLSASYHNTASNHNTDDDDDDDDEEAVTVLQTANLDDDYGQADHINAVGRVNGKHGSLIELMSAWPICSVVGLGVISCLGKFLLLGRTSLIGRVQMSFTCRWM
jgi:hypothetical protein